ncbi:MT-A70 family methyltransferase [Microcoleus sp. D3_18a_C4]|uniref:MT-A70 family methyltransferase n=1 Tax=Microcoleus sp. D3_18a_C4 TaxID=3055332 RepID=UPI002FD4A74F
MKYQADDKIGQLKLSIALNLIPGLPPIQNIDYRLIVCDPPWNFTLRETDATHRGRCPYPAMSDEQILSLPISAIAHQNSYLLLWVTNNHLPLGFRCLERWGFTYKSIFTWVKTTKASTEQEPKVNFGIGHYGRNCTEHFLVATKGNPGSFTSHGLTNIPNTIFASRSKHSEKPQEFWTVADRLAKKLGGSKIELFARSKRNGWDSWGAEVN